MKHVNVRMDDETHAALRALAEAEARSLNAMLIMLVRRAAERAK